MTVILAIECSQRAGGVSLRDATGGIHTAPLPAHGPRDDEMLMPTIDRLVRGAGLTSRDIEAVGVSIGPGGFTGLRIAVATAKMLALALGVSVLAVPAALVVAESIVPEKVGGGPVLIVLASKKSIAWSARFLHDGIEWRASGPGETREVENISLDGVRAVIGDRYLPAALLARSEKKGIPVIEPTFDPAACLAIAARMLARGETVDPHVLLPLYARPPEAVTRWVARGGSPL